MLCHLRSSIGVTDTALQWFPSYFFNRSQRVLVERCKSDRCHLSSGGHQGSCLGPLLSGIYASKRCEVMKGHLPKVHAYADDTQLYLSFKPGNTATRLGALTAIERCIIGIRRWMLIDKLRINDGNTELMIIGTRQQLAI